MGGGAYLGFLQRGLPSAYDTVSTLVAHHEGQNLLLGSLFISCHDFLGIIGLSLVARGLFLDGCGFGFFFCGHCGDVMWFARGIGTRERWPELSIYQGVES